MLVVEFAEFVCEVVDALLDTTLVEVLFTGARV